MQQPRKEGSSPKYGESQDIVRNFAAEDEKLSLNLMMMI